MHHNTSNNKEAVATEHHNSESGWKTWQGLYAIKRKNVFLRIVDALKKHLPVSR